MSSIANARGFGVVGVLMIHATGPLIMCIGLGVAMTDTVTNLIVLFLNQISRYCVPVFFFLSAYLYGRNYRQKKLNYWNFLSKRFRSIGFSYLFWTVVYIFCDFFTKSLNIQDVSTANVLGMFFLGDAYGHLYFIPALFQFYLLLPIFLSFNEVTREKLTRFWWIFLIFIFAIFFYEAKIQLLSSGDYSKFIGRHCFVWWWLPYLFLGGVLGSRGARIGKTEKRIVVAVLMAAIGVMVYETVCVFMHIPFYYSMTLGTQGLGGIVTFAKPSAAVFSLSCCLLLGDYLERSHTVSESILTKLGVYSFGIYLMHPLANWVILGFLHRVGFIVQGTLLGVIAPLLVGSALALIGTVILASLPKINWMVGLNRVVD